jgi:phosphatidylglycerol:prolipoprotein diacylglycerol transferase
MVSGVLILPVLGNYFIKSTWKQYADYLVPSIVLFQSIGKIGCYYAGCCSGVYCSDSQSILLLIGSEYQKKIPVQLYESTSLFIMFFIFFYLNRSKKLPIGFLAALYILFYGIHRFFFEFIRADGIIVMYITPAQYISIFLSLTALFLLRHTYNNR